MKLTQTNSGNWAKQVEISRGHELRDFFKTRAEAEAAASLGEVVVPVVLGTKLAQRLYGVKDWQWIPKQGGGNILTPFVAGEPLTGLPVEYLPCGYGVNCDQFAAYGVGVSLGVKMVMQHASREECLAAGKEPGKMND